MRIKRTYVATLVFVALLGGGLWWFFFQDRAPASLSEALLQRKDELPPQQFVMLPPTAQSRLGFEPEGTMEEAERRGRRLSTRPVPCFFVVPASSPSISEMTVEYQDSRSLSSEWGAVLAKAAGTIESGDTASVTLRNLSSVRALGVPNLTSPCNFEAGTLNVISSEMVAGTVEVKFSRELSGSVDGGSGPGGASAGTLAGDASWQKTTKSMIQGSNIVVSGGVSNVRVDVTRVTHNLGNSPKSGYGLKLPDGFEGSVTVDRFDDSVQNLGIRAEVQAPTQDPPRGLQTCAASKTEILRPLARCQFWLEPGNALLAVTWRYSESPDNAAGQVVMVDITGYRTRWPDIPSPRRQ